MADAGGEADHVGDVFPDGFVEVFASDGAVFFVAVFVPVNVGVFADLKGGGSFGPLLSSEGFGSGFGEGG